MDLWEIFFCKDIYIELNKQIFHIDFFSLVVEYTEMDILKSIPFDKVRIELFVIYYAAGNATQQQLVEIKKNYIKELIY